MIAVGQVLVRVKASGVNPLDIKIRAGIAAHGEEIAVPIRPFLANTGSRHE
jgi:NADPH:quinone reductase-like Zn-dependent oxidoreductase